MLIFDYLSSHNYLFLFFALVLGLMIGSFLNVVIYRLPIMLERSWKAECAILLEQSSDELGAQKESFNLVIPNSHCPNCQRPIRAWENIPIISYLFLKGQCAGCQAKIPLRYPAVELFTGLLSLFVAYHFGVSWLTLLALVLTWALIALSVIDIDHQLLPDNMTLSLLWLGLIVNTFGLLAPLTDALWGAVFGYLSLWFVYWCFKLLTGKEGMGYGDFKLLAALGAWLGWQALPLIIILSSFVGAVLGVTMLIFQGKDRNTTIPFGPYLAIAGWVALIWSHELISWYLGFAGIN